MNQQRVAQIKLRKIFELSKLAALPLLVCLLYPAVARADQTACTPVFTVAEAPIALAWREKSERRIEVLSADGKEHKLRVRVGDVAMTDAEGKKLTTTDFIKVDPEAATVTIDGIQLLITVARTTAVRPGVYLGSLTFSEEGATAKNCALRRTIQVTVADAAPLSDKITLHAHRLVPFTSLWTCGDCLVPLKSPLEVKTTALRNDMPLGGVQNKEGGAAAVYWTGGPSIASDGLTSLPVSLRGLDRAGQYEGRLRIGSATDDASLVTLTLDASDIVIWPILVIAISMVIGLLAQRYLNVMRTIWRLRQEEAGLGTAFADAQRHFAEEAGNSTFASYSIAEDFELKRRELRAKISELQSGSILTIDTASDKNQSVLNSFKALRDAIAAWNVFGEELKAFRDAKERQDPGTPPNGFNGSEPNLIVSAGKLLLGEKLTLERFAEREKQVQEATGAVLLWFLLRNRLAEDRQHVAELQAVASSMMDEQRETLQNIETNLNTAELILWRADTPEKLDRLTESSSELQIAESALEVLLANLDLTPSAIPMVNSVIVSVKLGALKNASARVPATVREPADDHERHRFFANAIQRWDLVLTLLAFIIATLTALNMSYFGKSFGSFRDYIGLIILGMGTKIAVDTAGAALGSLFGAGRTFGVGDRATP